MTEKLDHEKCEVIDGDVMGWFRTRLWFQGMSASTQNDSSAKSLHVHFVCKGTAETHARLQPALEEHMAKVRILRWWPSWERIFLTTFLDLGVS